MDHEAEGHRAIGRWMVQFARLVGGMRTSMETRLHGANEDLLAVRVAFSRATAAQISDSFFAMCRLVGGLDEDDEKIASSLRAEVTKAIEQRNRIAHGDWILGQGNTPDSAAFAHLMMVDAKAKPDPWHVQTFTTDELDERSDRLRDVGRLTFIFGGLALGFPLLGANDWISPGRHRIAEVLAIEPAPKGEPTRVVLGGARASDFS